MSYIRDVTQLTMRTHYSNSDHRFLYDVNTSPYSQITQYISHYFSQTTETILTINMLFMGRILAQMQFSKPNRSLLQCAYSNQFLTYLCNGSPIVVSYQTVHAAATHYLHRDRKHKSGEL